MRLPIVPQPMRRPALSGVPSKAPLVAVSIDKLSSYSPGQTPGGVRLREKELFNWQYSLNIQRFWPG